MSDEKPERYRPFINGTEEMMFEESNCSGCWRSKPKRPKQSSASHCKLIEDITLGALTDGTIAMESADRIGMTDPKWDGMCRERQKHRPPPKPRKRKLAPGQGTLAFEGEIPCGTKS